MASWRNGRGFLGCDGLQGGSEMFPVVQADGTDRDQGAMGMGCGGIQPASQTGLQHQPVGALGFKVHQGCTDQLFEGGEPAGGHHRLQSLQQAAQLLDGDQLVVHADAFAPAQQVGRDGET